MKLAMANDLLYEASLHLGASPQKKRSSLLYKTPTVGKRQQLEGAGFVERSLLHGPERAASACVQPLIHNYSSKEAMVDSNRPILGVVPTFEH
jgi:hypothetical protein